MGFSLAAFMAAQTDGFWYDFTKTDRLFQENVGPTPAAANGDVIGLALDQRTWGGKTLAQVLAASPELIVNGDFATSAAWSLNSGWVISGGQLSASVEAFSGASQAISFIRGRVYRVSFDITSISSGSMRPVLLGGAQVTGTSRASAGTYVEYLIATDNARLALQSTSAGFVGSIDNVSVKEVSSGSATQATTSLKPKLAATGAAFDGSDDALLSGYAPGAVENFVVAKVVVPPTISGSGQSFLGAQTATDRFRLDVSISGQLQAALGSAAISTTGIDLRGQAATVGLSCNGATARLFVNGDLVLTAVQPSGALPTSMPIAIGAANINNSRALWFAGSIGRVVAGREFIDLDTFKKIAAAL